MVDLHHLKTFGDDPIDIDEFDDISSKYMIEKSTFGANQNHEP